MGPAPKRQTRLLAGLALGVIALVLLVLRFAGAPSSGSPVVPPTERSELPRVAQPEPGPVAAARDLAAPDLAPSGAEAPLDAQGPRGTLEVALVGWPAGAPQGTAVTASRWRSHTADEVRVAERGQVAEGTDACRLRLELGSYAVRATAPGWACAPARVVLDPQTPDARIELTMLACAPVRGSVRGASGDPVQDLPVHVIDGTGQLLDSTATAFLGGFELACVPPGTWLLVLGNLQGPLLDPREVVVGPHGAQVPELVLPDLGALEIVVRDEAGAVLPDLELHGLGGTGGRLHLRTDFNGRASSELALPGSWRVFGDAGPLGRGNTVLEVEAGGRAHGVLVLRRPR